MTQTLLILKVIDVTLGEFPSIQLLENKSSTAILMVSSTGMLANNDSTSRLAIKRLYDQN